MSYLVNQSLEELCFEEAYDVSDMTVLRDLALWDTDLIDALVVKYELDWLYNSVPSHRMLVEVVAIAERKDKDFWDTLREEWARCKYDAVEAAGDE